MKKLLTLALALTTLATAGIIYDQTDTDGDGVIDEFDRCPTEIGLSEYFGCPELPKVPSHTQILFDSPGSISLNGVVYDRDTLLLRDSIGQYMAQRSDTLRAIDPPGFLTSFVGTGYDSLFFLG